MSELDKVIVLSSSVSVNVQSLVIEYVIIVISLEAESFSSNPIEIVDGKEAESGSDDLA